MQHGPTLSDGLAIQASVMKRGWQLHRLDQALALGEAIFDIEQVNKLGRVVDIRPLATGLMAVEYEPRARGFARVIAAVETVLCE